MAMPTPCGEIASGPSRTRSRTGHPIAARVRTAASLPNHPGRDGPRPPVPESPSEEHSPGHIGRVMHAEIHARARHEAGHRAKTEARHRWQFKIPTGNRDEREEDHGVTARPRRSGRPEDQQTERAPGVVGTN